MSNSSDKSTSLRSVAKSVPTDVTVLQKLAKVQAELKAPKNQYNKFGKYKYRSKEDIFEAAKPLCIKHGLVLVVNDSLECIGERYYIKATARVTCLDTGDVQIASGYAREAENQKGMDSAQLTGSTSSYAGKYALGNLFGLDDTKDSDATNTHGKTAVVQKKLKMFKMDQNYKTVAATLKTAK